MAVDYHQLTEQHDHWWLDIPSSKIIRMPSCYAHQTSSVDVPVKNNGSVDITVDDYIKTKTIHFFFFV